MKSFFDRLRGKETKPQFTEEDSSTRSVPGAKLIMDSGGSRIEPQQLISFCGQSIGKQRWHNEDCLFTFSATMGGEARSAPLGLFILADGMGGYQYGEVASSAAVRTTANYLLNYFHNYMISPSAGMGEPPQEVMKAAIADAHQAVSQAAPGGGTTLTVVLVLGQQMTIGHVGDSRACALHQDGRVEILTKDHSLVKRLEELGKISTQDAAKHPQRNVLYRALGQEEMLEPDIFTLPFPQRGTLLLCSDGLWSVISDKEIYNLLAKAPTLQGACLDMIAAANNSGGPDNISVILVQLIG